MWGYSTLPISSFINFKWHKIVYFIIVIRNEKIVWKHGPYCWYFCLNLKYLGWPYRAYIKTAKNGDFCEGLLIESDFEVVLATFCSPTAWQNLVTRFLAILSYHHFFRLSGLGKWKNTVTFHQKSFFKSSEWQNLITSCFDCSYFTGKT